MRVERLKTNPYPALFDVLGAVQVRYDDADARARDGACDDVCWEVTTRADAFHGDERGQRGSDGERDPGTRGVRRARER